jgi:hypothetical protein
MDLAPKIRAMSLKDLAMLGLNDVAYVRTGVNDGMPGFIIHAADGNAVGFAPSLQLARRMILQNDLEPISVH